MSELRRRKAGSGKDKNRPSGSHANERAREGQQKCERKLDQVSWFTYANFIIGVTIALIVGVKYALYVRELHENDMWFSNIGVSGRI